MLQYRQCKIGYREGMTDGQAVRLLRKKIARKLRVSEDAITNLMIGKKSLDARKKPELFYTYTAVFECRDEADVLRRNRGNKELAEYVPPPDLLNVAQAVRTSCGEGAEEIGKAEKAKKAEIAVKKAVSGETDPVVVVGSGPAGLMCGYFLALCGRRPVIIERGGPMCERVDQVSRFWKDGTLDAQTNVSFGEGGAGTFSDGKLNTGVKDRTGMKAFILDTFVRHGAPEEILYLAKPHIGTDELRGVIESMRGTIEECGGTYLFHTLLTGFVQREGKDGKNCLTGVRVWQEREGHADERVIPCGACVLAIGHSARDTFQMLFDAGIRMEQKPFAVGVRVQHPQTAINEAQYGFDAGGLPAADYKLTGRMGDGRGVYSFCMCPGGYVVNASTEDGMTAVNGMSNHARDSGSANSAIIVSVCGEDFGSSDALAGVEFQRELERRTYAAGGGRIPVQRFGDFAAGQGGQVRRHLEKQMPSHLLRQTPCTKGDFVWADVNKILPPFVADGIIEGMRQFGAKLSGFDDDDALVLGTETRTSSPVRIVRDEELVSVSLDGLYPCGEGAGYAGGIMSAAMDGLKVALRLVGGR